MITRPDFLKSGDKVGIMAPARKVSPSEIETGIEIIKSWGLDVIESPTLFSVDNQYAGTDSNRTEELQLLLDNPEIKAVFFARGGYGGTRIIDQLDFTKFKESPKWLCGFSDNTVFHCHLSKLNIVSLHSTVPYLITKHNNTEAISSLKSALFGNLQNHIVPGHSKNRLGQASGKLVGGNLSLVVNQLGTVSEPVFTNSILFLEDLDENHYHVDRMFVQLKRAGILKSISGLIIGDFSDMKDTSEYFGKDVHEIVLDHTGTYNYPISFGFPAGHEPRNLALYMNSICTLDVQESVTVAFNV